MSEKLLTPEALDNLQNLSLVAERVVEGFLAGLHRSPYHGFSLEFAEYRQYMPGDDLRYFEWKALGKSDRYYIKKYQSETNMRAHILLDSSASMGYASGKVSKLRWGAALAAALTHLMIRQHDAVGVTFFADRILDRLPPGRGPRHRHQALTLLESARPDRTTRTAHCLHRLAESISSRGMVILVSDLFDDEDAILDGIRHLSFKGHEVIVFQVLDPLERYFSFSGFCEFQDMETGMRMLVEPQDIGSAVREEVDGFLRRIHDSLITHSIDYREALTHEPFDLFLAHYLHQRMRRIPWSS